MGSVYWIERLQYDLDSGSQIQLLMVREADLLVIEIRRERELKWNQSKWER